MDGGNGPSVFENIHIPPKGVEAGRDWRHLGWRSKGQPRGPKPAKLKCFGNGGWVAKNFQLNKEEYPLLRTDEIALAAGAFTVLSFLLGYLCGKRGLRILWR